MTALATEGRQTEALRSYNEYHQYLADEVGTQPSAELRDLETKIASGEHPRTEALGLASGKVPPPALLDYSRHVSLTGRSMDLEDATAVCGGAMSRPALHTN
jgi:hypothetical protein